METSLIHHEQVSSLAPVDDQLQKNDKPFQIDEPLQAFFRKIKEKCEKQHRADWSNIKKGMVKCRNYFDNKQYGYVDDQLAWQDFVKDDGEITYTDNAYQYYVQTALTELMRSKPELSFSHVSDSRNGELIAKVAEMRYRTYRKTIFDSTKLAQEKLSMLLNGIAARYTYFDKSERGEKVPVFGEGQASGSTISVCAMCQTPKQDEGECPRCGGTDVATLSSEGGEFKVITGYEDTMCGHNEWVSVDPLGLTFYLNASTVKESPYIHWKQAVLTEILRAQFPDIKITEGLSSPELKDQFDSASASPLGNISAGSDSGLSEWTQCWWDVALYGQYKSTQPIRLRSGVVIPPNLELGKVFPKGIYVAFQGDVVVDVWPEDRCDKWTIAPYVTRPGTMIGAGTTVAIGNQDIKNDLRNLHMASIMRDAFRKEFVNMQYIEGESIPNSPTERAVVTGLATNQRIVGNVIDALPPSPLSPDAYNLEDRIDQSMQSQIGAFSATGAGSPDLKAVQDTASGFLAYREMAVGRYGPMLSVAADALDKAQAYQFLVNDQKNLTDKQWEQVRGEYGAEAVKMFRQCDLRKELLIEVVSDSYLPTSTAQKQGQVRAFGQTLMEMQIPPNSELGAYIGAQFHIPEHLVGFNSQYNTARSQIEVFAQVAEMITEQFGDVATPNLQDPKTLQLAQVVLQESNEPFNPELDDGVAMIEALKDWWATDAGRDASNLLKATVSLRVREIKAGGAQAMADEQALAMAAQAPQMQTEQEQAAQQEASANEMAVAERLADEMSATEQQEREAEKEAGKQMLQMAENEAERENRLELAKINAANTGR